MNPSTDLASRRRREDFVAGTMLRMIRNPAMQAVIAKTAEAARPAGKSKNYSDINHNGELQMKRLSDCVKIINIKGGVLG